MALRCARASEARRGPRSGERINAGDVRVFEWRSIDCLATDVSSEPRLPSSFFLKGLADASFTDIAKDFQLRRFKQGPRVAHCALQVMFLFSAPTAARRYGFSSDLLKCPRNPSATISAHLAMPGRGPVSSSHPRQRGSSVCSARPLGSRRRRID